MMAIAADPVEDIRFERATGTIGAWVQGIPLTGGRSPQLVKAFQEGLHEHGVLFFQYDHVLSAEEFAAFGEWVGELEDGYRISSLEDKPKGDGVMDSDRVPMKQYNTNQWHSDGTLFERPPQAAMLTPVELPPAGGDTMWGSMYAAWDDLSSHYQQLLEGLEVLHSAKRLPWLKSEATAVHPAVIRDPITGRKILFVNANYSERFLGMSDWESENLLQMLFQHVNTPEYHVRLKWQPGCIAVWEERVTQHRGVADFTGTRKMRRLTFIGDRPAS
ncbi:MAG: TauD/TfdA family dioxygenase [Sphingobium sp.]